VTDHPPELLSAGPITEDGVVVLKTTGTEFWVQVRDEAPDDLVYLWALSEDGPQHDFAQPIESEHEDIGGSKLTLPYDSDYDGQSLIVPIHDAINSIEFSWDIEVIE